MNFILSADGPHNGTDLLTAPKREPGQCLSRQNRERLLILVSVFSSQFMLQLFQHPPCASAGQSRWQWGRLYSSVCDKSRGVSAHHNGEAAEPSPGQGAHSGRTMHGVIRIATLALKCFIYRFIPRHLLTATMVNSNTENADKRNVSGYYQSTRKQQQNVFSLH